MKCKHCNGTGIDDDRLTCYECGGTGEVEMTNFDNITKSVETLASWLDEHMEFCDEIPCDECCEYKECWHQGCDVDFSSNAKRWLMWLKQPHKEN